MAILFLRQVSGFLLGLLGQEGRAGFYFFLFDSAPGADRGNCFVFVASVFLGPAWGEPNKEAT